MSEQLDLFDPPETAQRTVERRSCGCPTWYEPFGDALLKRGPGHLNEFSDDGLTRLARSYRRAVEDGDRSPTPPAAIRTIRAVQLGRLRLRMRYGARFGGTLNYDCYYRHDTPPSYELAMLMDEHHWRAGHRHVLDWPRLRAAVTGAAGDVR